MHEVKGEKLKTSEKIMHNAIMVSIGFALMYVIVSAMILEGSPPSMFLRCLFWLSCGGVLVSTGVFLIALMDDAR